MAVPSPLSEKVTPVGSAPALVIAGSGNPVVVTVKEPAEPTRKVVEVPLVMTGGASTFKVKLWVAFDPTPLAAVMVRG